MKASELIHALTLLQTRFGDCGVDVVLKDREIEPPLFDVQYSTKEERFKLVPTTEVCTDDGEGRE